MPRGGPKPALAAPRPRGLSSDVSAEQVVTASCPTCGTAELQQLRTHGDAPQYTLNQCMHCGLQHWSPRVAPGASYYEDEGQALYAAMHAGFRRAEDDPRFARFLSELPERGVSSLLDVGCSDGTLLSAAAARGVAGVGIDIDRRSLSVARGRGLEVHEAKLADFASTLAAGRTFDRVTMFDVLEHLTEPRSALLAAIGLLAPGGLLVGTVPNRERIFVNLVRTDFPPHHFIRFDRRSLGEMLRSVGATPLQIDVFQWGYAGPTLLDATVKRTRALMRRGSPGAIATRGGEAGVATPPAVPIRRRLSHVAASTVAAASARIERAVGRGFKLYFVAGRNAAP